jgi:O-antigen biosynthesis protein
MPYTTLEVATQKGIRYICSAVGGINEAIPSQHTFSPTVEKLATKIIQVVQNPDMYWGGSYDWIKVNTDWIKAHEHIVRTPLSHPISISSSPDIDIIIPHYRHIEFLPQALESIKLQTYPHLYVYVGDDDSQKPEILTKFDSIASQYPQWKFIKYPKNKGIGGTRNALVQQGKSDYIIFFDADNIAKPNMVESFINAITTSNDDCLTCYAWIFEKIALFPIITGAYQPLGNDLLSGIFFNTFGDSNFIIKRQVFENLGGFKQNLQPIYEDYEFLARLILKKYKHDVLPEYLFNYRQHSQGYSKRVNQLQAQRNVLKTYDQLHSSSTDIPLAQLAYALFNNNMINEQIYDIGTPASQFPAAPTDVYWYVHRVRWRTLLKALWLKARKYL